MTQIENVVSIATSQIGYKEKKTNSNLDDFSANAGSGNYNKYSRDLYNAGFFNGNKNGYPWCTSFVTWVYWCACEQDTKRAKTLACQTGDLAASCTYASGYYKKLGRLFSNPEVGDQIFFGKEGSVDHTGIVVDVTSSSVVVIEGNSSNSVKKITYKKNNSNIYGYGRPRWEIIKKSYTVTKTQNLSEFLNSNGIELSKASINKGSVITIG